MKSKLKLPNRRFVFLTSILSVMCILFMGCADTDDLIVPSSDACESIGLKLELRSADKTITIPETGWAEGVATTTGCRIDLNYSEYGVLNPGTWHVIYRDLPAHGGDPWTLVIEKKPSGSMGDGNGAGASSDIDRDKRPEKTVLQFDYMNLPAHFGTLKPKDYTEVKQKWETYLKTLGCDSGTPESAECRAVYDKSRQLVLGITKKIDSETTTETEPDDETDFKNAGLLGSSIGPGSSGPSGWGFSVLALVLGALWMRKDREMSSTCTTKCEDTKALIASYFSDKRLLLFGVMALSLVAVMLSFTVSYGTEIASRAVPAFFATACMVGAALALPIGEGRPAFSFAVKHSGHEPAGGYCEVPHTASDIMLACENTREREEEDSYETRRRERDNRLYTMYTKAFRSEPDEMGRKYLLDCLLNRLPKKGEVIRKAFEDTQKAA